MNSVRKPRARPRIRSINFRVFFWLLTREAALQILGWENDGQLFEAPRELLAWNTRPRLRRMVKRELEMYPFSRCTGGLPPATLPGGWVQTL
jgi:hypothetical protein